MKIIFLDIDGVLNSKTDFIHQRELDASHRETIFDNKLELLSSIVEATKANIVLTSTMRRISKDRHYINHKLHQYDMAVFSQTKYLGEAGRGEEIKEWLDSHADIDIESFVILDDDIFDMGDFIDSPNMVKTSNDTGLTTELADKAIQILNAGNDI